MIKPLFTLLISLSLFSNVNIAQKTMKGKVTDATFKSPLSGATIYFENNSGKTIKTTTDIAGNFIYDCSKGSFFIVSHVGYESKRIEMKNCDESILVNLFQKVGTLGEVEVTATSNQNKSILYQPVSITKLTPLELKRGNGLFLSDAINSNVPGVTMQSRSVAGGQQFNIRGYGNGSGGTSRINSNFDGQGYKVYFNGIPITDAEGITVMDDIDFGSVGNVEITKGPAGTVYGLAASGVINLKSIQPEKGKTSVGQEMLFGSNGLQRLTTHFQTSSDHSSVLVNYGKQKSDGYTVHNSSQKDFINVIANFNSSPKQSMSIYFGYSHSYDERSGELTLTQWANNDYSGNIEYIKRNGHSELNSFRAGVSHNYDLSKNISFSNTIFGSGVSNNASSAGGWTDKDPVNAGMRSTINVNIPIKNSIGISGITGLEMQKQIAQTIGYGMIDPQGTAHANSWKLGDPYFIIGSTATGSNGITSNKYTTTANSSVFSEWTLSLPRDLSIITGIGISRMLINLNDRFYVPTNTKPTTFDTSYQSMVSPHFALNKIFNKHFSAYFSYSKGYKAPVSSYFYLPFVATAASSTGVINQGLKPEIANQFEVGTKGSLNNGKLNYQLAFFNAIFSNKMTAINVLNTAGTSTLYTYIANSGQQNDKGIEGLIKYAAFKSEKGFIATVEPFVNFTISNFKYEDYSFNYKGTILKDSIVNYDGKSVAGVAKFIGNFGIDITTNNGLYFNTIYSYKDGFPISADGKNNTSSYSIWNTKIGIKRSLLNHLTTDIFLGINNLTNTRYPMMVFINQLPDAYMAGPTMTNYFGGVNLKYNF